MPLIIAKFTASMKSRTRQTTTSAVRVDPNQMQQFVSRLTFGQAAGAHFPGGEAEDLWDDAAAAGALG